MPEWIVVAVKVIGGIAIYAAVVGAVLALVRSGDLSAPHDVLPRRERAALPRVRDMRLDVARVGRARGDAAAAPRMGSAR